MSNYRIDRWRLSLALKALAHPNRLRIYTRLVDCCPPGTRCRASRREARACVGDLGRDLGIAASTVSHHVQQLHRAGLIHMERCGQNVECWIASETLGAIAEFFESLRSGGKRGRTSGRQPGGPRV